MQNQNSVLGAVVVHLQAGFAGFEESTQQGARLGPLGGKDQERWSAEQGFKYKIQTTLLLKCLLSLSS